MRRSERAVRTPWRQERRQRYAQERRHLSSAMRHRWGRALTRARSERPAGLHRPQKGPGGEGHKNPSLFARSWPWGEAVTREPGGGAVHVSVPSRLFIDRLSIAWLSVVSCLRAHRS